MNLLFLTIDSMESIEERGIYSDLLREFRDNGHTVYVVTPRQKRMGKCTEKENDNGVHLLHVKIGNITSCGIIEKGISTVMIESQYKSAIKTYFKDVKFDLVMYSTPPITLGGVVEYIKRRDGARSYLLLKDIFPQNSLDLEMLSKKGLKGLIYRYFRAKERKLYALSDKIGCMSRANVEFVLNNNPSVSPDNVEVCPNCVELTDMRISNDEKTELRKKYGLPLDKKIFVYGGNLGRPQDVPFIVECLKKSEEIENVFFVIAGGGTDRHFLEEYCEKESPSHVKLFGYIPKDEYDKMIACCDVGLIFLDHRFTIPNFPSRLLSYMQVGLPVLACTDKNTDIGQVIVDGGFGWWCESVQPSCFKNLINSVSLSDTSAKSEKSFEYLKENYTVKVGYNVIIESVR